MSVKELSKTTDLNCEVMLTKFGEMTTMTETNSEHITALIGLVKSQNKSLQTLQRQVYKLQGKIGVEDDDCSDTEEDTEKVQVRELFCDLCENRHTALYHCKDCSENLCETIAGIHKKGKATKGHLVLLLSEMKVQIETQTTYEIPIYKETAMWNPAYDESKISISGISGLVFSRKGEIYIFDNSNKTVTLFTKSGTYIRPISKYDNLGDGSIRIDSSDYLNILISEEFIWKKYIIDSNGSLRNTISINKPTHNVNSQQRDPNPYSNAMIPCVVKVPDDNTGSINYGEISENTVIKTSSNGDKIFIFNKNGKEVLNFSINLHTDFTVPKCTFVQVSPKGELYVVDMANHIVKVFSEGGKFLRTIGRPSKDMFSKISTNSHYIISTELDNGEFHFYNGYNSKLQLIQFTDKGEVYIQDKNRVQVFSEEGRFLYKVCECTPLYFLEKFAVNPLTGDVAVISYKHHVGSYNIHILEVTGKYTRKPKENYFDLDTSLLQKSTESVLSVTFPISIKRDRNDNLFTHTLYFREPTPVKRAIHQVEEYFRQRVTKEEFNEIRSVCNFASLHGDVRGDYMNWESCKKAKVIRGYFLGGEILKSVSVNRGNLFLDITDCFISLK